MQKEKYSPNEALALIIASTRTRKRPVSISEIANAIDIALEKAGSLNKLAEQIGLSAKMLRQFLQVNKLAESVRTLVKERLIDSVDAVSHISRLQEKDQEAVAKKLAEGNWDTFDIRAFHELRTAKPCAEVDELVHQIQNSKSIQEFVFEFLRRQGISEDDVINKLSEFIDRDAIKNISFNGSKGTLILNKSGRDKLFEIAKIKSVAVRDVISRLLY